MQPLNRRNFLSLSAAAVAGMCSGPVSAKDMSQAAPGSLRFVFFTDTHLQPELKGDVGTALAMARIRALRPDFCIQGGDHCFDINAVPRERSMMLLDLYAKTERALDGIPVHHALGNHDVFGSDPRANVPGTDPLWGKKMFEQRFATKTYYSFDRKGYHFVVLDSVGMTPDGEFEGRVDAAQIAWLATDLAGLAKGTPVIAVTHIPLVSAIAQYKPDDRVYTAGRPESAKKHNYFLVENSYDVLPAFEGHNVIAVLQGHTHVNETVYWRNTPYITSGAVSGNWWKGSRWGTPEGFTVVELSGGKAEWRYETYGWASVAAEKDPLAVIARPRVG